MPDENEAFEIEEHHEPPVEDVDPRTGIPWGVIVLFVGLILVVVFAVQNTELVRVEFLWLDAEFPLSIIILLTAGISVLLGQLLGVVYRKRRRQRRAEKAELQQLRDGS